MRRLKAEWEQQKAILMVFPHQNSDWGRHIEQARICFCNIIQTILDFEPVILCIDPRDDDGLNIVCKRFRTIILHHNDNTAKNNIMAQGRAKKHILEDNFNKSTSDMLESNNKHLKHSDINTTYPLYICRIKSNDTWVRDFGAISVEKSDKSIITLDFGFNGWGLKYPANDDNQITQHLARILKQNRALKDIFRHLQRVNLILEGGSIDSNGECVLLTNTQCLLEPNRNPALSKNRIESHLKRYLGIKNVLWLNYGYLAGDDTDSHIDTLARFLAPDMIAYVACEDKNDEHFEALNLMKAELRALKTTQNQPYKLVALPFTRPIYDEVGNRLPSSYANFLFVNGGLLVPMYNDENDKKTLKILSKACPNRKIVGIDCQSLILWHGSLHCVTMQLY